MSHQHKNENYLPTFCAQSVKEKLQLVEKDIHILLQSPATLWKVPQLPGRNVSVVALSAMPQKPPMQDLNGKMRLVHDLAHIELQAMELGLRTLTEFPDVTSDFRTSLANLILDEARHLKLLLGALEHHGYSFGSFPVHLSLWDATSSEDSLIDRILIVHRYLEGSGLDAGDKILKRLSGQGDKELLKILKVIVEEEVGHVSFGSQWFGNFCKAQGLDPERHFADRMRALHSKLPKRVMKLDRQRRRQAGFLDSELDILDDLR